MITVKLTDITLEEDEHRFIPHTQKQLFSKLGMKHNEVFRKVIKDFREKADNMNVKFHTLTEIFDFGVMNKEIDKRLGEDKIIRIVDENGELVGFRVI